jgi:hypothetical protein
MCKLIDVLSFYVNVDDSYVFADVLSMIIEVS